LPAKYDRSYAALTKLMDPSRNMACYRAELSRSPAPLVPFFPLLKKDLTFIHLAHPTELPALEPEETVSGKPRRPEPGEDEDEDDDHIPDEQLVNWEKFRMLGKEIRKVMSMSAVGYLQREESVETVPLPPPPPTTSVAADALLSPKRLFEETVMRNRVKLYLDSVFGGNGVELVIVTASTGQCKTEKCFSEHIDLIVHVIGFVLQDIGRCMSRLMKIPETRPQDRFIELLLRIASRLPDEISRDVFLGQQIIGKVGIECPDQVVPVFGRVRNRVVEFVTVRFGVADQVHPMPRPFLAKVSGFKQLRNDLLMSLG